MLPSCAEPHRTLIGKARRAMKGRAQTTVSCEIQLRLVVSSGSSVPVPAELRYETSDPYAVHATFHTGESESVDWVFARDLLADGLRRAAGSGDVRVWPVRRRGQDLVCIALSSPEGHALLEAPARTLQTFLDRTNAAVRPGTEHRYFDIDVELAQLLADTTD